jgi:hypothetical protein
LNRRPLDARQRATEFVKELYAAGEIDADRLIQVLPGCWRPGPGLSWPMWSGHGRRLLR